MTAPSPSQRPAGATGCRTCRGRPGTARRALTVAKGDEATQPGAALIRSGIVRARAEGGFRVVGDAGDADALLAAVDADPPDLVVTDIRMTPTTTDEGCGPP